MKTKNEKAAETTDVIAHVERMRQLHDELLIAEQEWQDGHDVGARVRRDQLLVEKQLARMASGPTSMGASTLPADCLIGSALGPMF